MYNVFLYPVDILDVLNLILFKVIVIKVQFFPRNVT